MRPIGINTKEITGTLTEDIQKKKNPHRRHWNYITVDCTGVLRLIQGGLEMTTTKGKMILVGVAPMEDKIELQFFPYMMVSFDIDATRDWLTCLIAH